MFSILLYLSYSQMIAITIKENLHHAYRMLTMTTESQGDMSHRATEIEFDAGIDKDILASGLFGAHHHVNSERTAVDSLQSRLHHLADMLADSFQLLMADIRLQHFLLLFLRSKHIARIGILRNLEKRQSSINNLSVDGFKLHTEIFHLI